VRFHVRMRATALLFCATLGAALSAGAQDGLKLYSRGEQGIDPSFASGWLNPERDRIGFQRYHWRDAIGFTPTQRMQWSYAFGQNGSLGMSVMSGRDFESAPIYGSETRQYGLFGRYSLAPDWSLSAETTLTRDPNNSLLRQEYRIGIRRQF
jgi:hypothetical protein